MKLTKKADSLFAGILIALIVVMIAYPVGRYIAIKKETKFDWIIGESQLLLIDTYEKGEKVLYYIDQSAKLAFEHALLDTDFDSCNDQECYLDLKQSLKQKFETKFRGYLAEYPDEPIPEIEYDYYLVEGPQLVGKTIQKLRMDITEDDEFNFKVESELKMINRPTDDDEDFEQSGECSYCYKQEWRFGWREKLKEWDPETLTRCNDKCCKAECPPDSKILDVPYVNQCDIKYGKHPYAQPSTYGYENLDACMAMCGPTAVQMVSDYYQGNYDVENEWSLLKSSSDDWYGGAYRTRMPNVLNTKTGHTFDIKGITSLNDLKNKIDQGKPVITGLYLPEKGCPDSSPYTYYCYNYMGHIFTVVGYAPGYIIINDPYTNSDGDDRWVGDNLVIPEQSFMKIWSGDSIFKA